MRPEHVDRVIAFMQGAWHLIEDDESKYKPEYVAALAPAVAAVDAGELAWADVLRMRRSGVNNLLGWRMLRDLEWLAVEHPEVVRQAVARLTSDIDADAFWDVVQDVLGVERVRQAMPELRGTGSRASIASYFLFLRDAHGWPVFRPRNHGAPLVRITGAPLDGRSPGAMLADFYRQLDVLGGRLREGGLAVRSRLDVQGILWVVNSSKVLL